MSPYKILQAALNCARDNLTRNYLEEIQIHSCGYAEKGYDDPESGLIATGNWNRVSQYNRETQRVESISDLPERVGKCLEKLGVELEWSDEWSCCDDCSKLIRTQPDSHFWTPSYVADYDKGTFLCKECAKQDETVDDDED